MRAACRPAWLALVAACGGVEPVVDANPPGQLAIAQIGLSGAIGESTLIVGPDGTTVLIDVGNDAHADAVLAAVDALGGSRALDAVILTHYHADHIGAFSELFDDSLQTDALIVRGLVDLDGANASELDPITETQAWTERVELCTATTCDLPWSMPLGDGADLVLYAANGRVWDGQSVQTPPFDLPPDSDGENARSIAGVVRYGGFVYGFAGDLTGGGKGTPDVEAAFAPLIPDDIVPARGVDVLHLDHHGIDSSTGEASMNRMLPADGAERDAIVGADGGYLDAPADEVLDRLRDRLGGGAVWAPAVGSLVDEGDEVLRVTGQTVVVRVGGDGAFSIGE